MFTDNLEELKKIFGKFDDKLLPMICSLNYIFGDNFIKILNDMFEEIGHGGNNIGFFFPSNFDPWDEEYFEEGIMFQWGIKGIIVDNQTFYKYLKKAVFEFILRCPNEQPKAKELLLRIKNKYNCQDISSVDKVLQLKDFNE